MFRKKGPTTKECIPGGSLVNFLENVNSFQVTENKSVVGEEMGEGQRK